MLGQHSMRRAVLGLFVGFALMTIWVFLRKQPAVAVQILPASVLSYMEGIGGVPAFLFIIGVVHARSEMRRQRRLSHLAVCLGVIYFVNGGLWMLQSTPALGKAGVHGRGMVMQSEEFTCVPASCANALNRLDIPTTEAEMARLTRVRPGTGATLIRAMDGLQRKLANTKYTVELIQPPLDELRNVPTPALTPLAFERTQQHMVVIESVSDDLVIIADPSNGRMFLEYKDLKDYYTGYVLVFNTR